MFSLITKAMFNPCDISTDSSNNADVRMSSIITAIPTLEVLE